MNKVILITTVIYFLIATISIICYFPRIKGFFGGFKPQKKYFNPKQNRFSIIIPARNESSVIETLLKSIKSQTYDESLIDIYVVVKDEGDKTIQIAKNYNCHIQICENQKRKGHVLNHYFNEILKNKPNEYDAHIILDADTFIHKDFVLEMNNGLVTGAKVINGRRLQKNRMANGGEGISLVADCSSIQYSMMDGLGSRYKSDNDLTITIVGTGLLLTNDYVKEMNGWHFFTLVEGSELKNELAMKDTKTFYQSNAIHYLEESSSLKVTNQRRKRWTEGSMEVKKIYDKKLKEIIRTGNEKQKRNIYFANSMQYLIHFYFASFVFMNLQFVYFAISLYQGLDWKASFTLMLLAALLMYSVFFILTLLSLIIDGDDMRFSKKRKIIILFIAPFFFLQYMFLTMDVAFKLAFRKKSNGWQEIRREDKLKYHI